MTCKDCFCFILCDLFKNFVEPKECRLFKNKADVVEVVRCKECKHWLKDVAGCTDFVGRCEWANYMVGANGYCVYGEKMDGKGEGE